MNNSMLGTCFWSSPEDEKSIFQQNTLLTYYDIRYGERLRTMMVVHKLVLHIQKTTLPLPHCCINVALNHVHSLRPRSHILSRGLRAQGKQYRLLDLPDLPAIQTTIKKMIPSHRITTKINTSTVPHRSQSTTRCTTSTETEIRTNIRTISKLTVYRTVSTSTH